MHAEFSLQNLMKRDHSQDPGIDVRIILRWLFRKRGGAMDWFDLAQDRDRWQAVVNTILNLRVP